MKDNDWTTDDRPWGLVDGALAFPDAPGEAAAGSATQLVATPGGEFVSLRLTARAWDRLDDVLTRRAAPATAVRDLGPDDRGAVAAVLELLSAEDLLTTGPDDAEPTFPGAVLVTGTTPVATRLIRLLSDQGCTAAAFDPTGDLPAETAAVVGCADWLPDPEWQALDAACRDAGVPWHRCWREGGTAWLGPLTVPGLTASYRDLRLRRLAASDWPAELEATWAHLAATPPPVPTWNPAVAALLAATIAADLTAHLDAGTGTTVAEAAGASDPAFRWRGFDLAGRRWHDHPVLPVPDGVMGQEPGA